MPEPRRRSGTFRRICVVLPGNRTVTHYEKSKPKKAHCAGCGRQLAGVPRERSTKLQNMPKTAKRPQRPYGGVLCSACSRQKIKSIARK